MAELILKNTKNIFT